MKSLTFDQIVEALDLLSERKRDKRLTGGEKTALVAAWEGLTYEEVAKQFGHEPCYIETTASHKLRNFVATELGNGQVTIGKLKLRKFLEANTETLRQLLNLPDYQEETGFWQGPLRVLGGQPPTISGFIGRQDELINLEEKLQKNKCVALEGPSGIGKSALGAKLIMQLAADGEPEFDCCVWKSIQYGPLPEELVAELIRLLTPPPQIDLELPERFQAKVSMLLDLLRSQRCLIVLDSAEGILLGQKSALNPYGVDHAEYEPFFWRLVEEQHSSCLLLLSNEPLSQVVRMKRDGLGATTMHLNGWKMEELNLYLRSQGLLDEGCWKELVERYEHNPLAIKDAVRQIKEYYRGSVSEFLSETLALGTFKESLDKKLGPVSHSTNLEREVLRYLAQQMERGVSQVSFSALRELKQREGPINSTSELMEAIDTLSRRRFITKIDHSKGLHLILSPLVKKYVFLDPLGVFKGLAG